MRASRRGIDHLLAVAVIGGDEHPRIRDLRAQHHPRKAPVHRFHSADGRVQLAGMAHHVSVGVVTQNEVVAARLDCAAQHVGNSRGAHLRHEVVRRHLLARHELALLVRERRLVPAVEEIGHVRVLLGLGGAKLRHPLLRKHLGHDSREHQRRKRNWKGEGLVVLRHGRGAHCRAPAHIESIETRQCERTHDLPHTVGSIVGEDDAVAVTHGRYGLAILVFDHDGLDELVGHVAIVSRLDCRHRIPRARSIAMHHGTIPLLGTWPALVAVHAEVSTPYRCDTGASARNLQQFTQESVRRARHRVASVEQKVNGQWHATPLAEFDECEQMLVDCVDSP